MSRDAAARDPARPPLPGAAATAACVLFLLVLAWIFWSTGWSTAAHRVAALRTIEPYAWAVHEQLVYNAAFLDDWFQTIHAGYDDAWTWSGHRAPTLWVLSKLYPLDPSAMFTAELQIGAVIAGAVPAALIGRRALRSPWGLALGGGIYLLHPAILALSLQDYQDLVFAVPALTFTLWTMRARSPAWVLLGAAVGVMPREECVPLVVACAVVTAGSALPAWRGSRRRRWLLNLGLTVLVAAVYAAFVQAFFPISTGMHPEEGHDTPLVGAMRTVLSARSLDDLTGLAHIDTFYSLIWAPVGALALLSPLTALPGVGLLVMHLTVEYGHGVDRFWGGHAHHIAPMMPFFAVATIEGAGRLLRWLGGPTAPARRPAARARKLAAFFAGAGLLAWSAGWVWTWGGAYNLVEATTPTAPAWEHPVWTLAGRLPEEAVPVVSVPHSLAVSDRSRSFTWEESLHDKGRGRGLGAGTHMIVHRELEEIVDWGLSMEGAGIVDEEGDYVTIAWEPGAVDRRGWKRERRWPQVPRWRPADLPAHLPIPGAPPPPPGPLH